MVILQVENEANDRELFERALARSRAEAVSRAVPDAVEAQNYLRGSGEYADRSQFPFPDLILLDFGMPLMSWEEFLEWLKDSIFNHIPVVVFTGSSDEQELQRARDLGALLTLRKPYSIQELEALVKRLAGLVLSKRAV